jgi:3'-phosphoadenosine 5'-phosphosulfate sulfotransferase (PAPS reductase)/FAD synthetase
MSEEDCFIMDDAEEVNHDGEITGLICFSGGKDSCAMFLRMIELDDPINYPITRICFADTNFEFPELYAYIDRIQKYLDLTYPEKGFVIEKLQADTTWDDWFYGEITRGNLVGKTRGAPLVTLPCWWSREAKVKPLEKAAKEINATYQFIGIAADETNRVSKDPKKIRYPLVEWGWTEQDCMAYLDHLGLGNILYDDFNRLGCFHCIKQKESNFHTLWAKPEYKELWEKAKFYSDENKRLTGRTWTASHDLDSLEKMFEKGYIPKSRVVDLECNTCNAVSFFSDGTVKMEDFDTDDAIEHNPKWNDSPMKQEEIEKAKEEIEWIPPSQRNTKNLEWW